MKPASLLVLLAVVSLIVGSIATAISANYEYERTIEAHWNLADKASTITAKAEKIDAFVKALDESGLHGQHNAAVFPTPDNAFDENFAALKTLQGRLHDIEKMDVKSFEYQTAIQQVTAQEQGEAKAMLAVFEGCWWKEHHPFLWNWWSALYILGLIIALLAALVFVAVAYDWQP